MIDLYNGDTAYTWEDDEIVFITSYPNAMTFSMQRLDFLKFVSELNKAAIRASELQREEYRESLIAQDPQRL